MVGDNLAHDPFGLDNSQSYLGMDATVLRDTAIPGYGHMGPGDMDQEARARLLASHPRFVGVMMMLCVVSCVSLVSYENFVMFWVMF